MNKFTSNCTIRKIGESIDTIKDSNNFRLKDPLEFFDLKDTTPQFVGRVRVC